MFKYLPCLSVNTDFLGSARIGSGYQSGKYFSVSRFLIIRNGVVGGFFFLGGGGAGGEGKRQMIPGLFLNY